MITKSILAHARATQYKKSTHFEWQYVNTSFKPDVRVRVPPNYFGV
jgi:hypothetical protein